MNKSDKSLNIALCLGGAFAVALLFISGCAMGPNYHRPATNPPGNFRFAGSSATNSLGDMQWQDVFQDPILQNLITIALTNNYNLKQAVDRVEEARYNAMAARSPLYPQVGYGGDVGRGRNSLYNSPIGAGGATQSSALAMLNATWEIDFWGRIRRLSQAAEAQYLATDEARQGVTITLISDVATTYYQLLDLDQELQIQREATNAYAGSYRIFNDRLINGAASKLETDRAAAALNGAAALIPQLEIQIAQTEDQLNILLGHNPGPVERGSLTNEPETQMVIPAGLPSDLLQRRPDVMAAEQSLVAANANVGANLANFFPHIGLTAFLGKASPELSTFTGGAANMWNAGATVSGPLFQGGQLYAQYKGSKASFLEAKDAYQQSVLVAFQEVSDALIAREKLSEVQLYYQQEAAALASSVDLATQRYLNGKSSYYEVLEAQQELYPAQVSQIQAQANEWISVVQLYKALGGGWKNPPKEPESKNNQAAPVPAGGGHS
ncbi:MAG TPA: efflux transporter outer membrane subunit [Pseudomonadales bacterium]|nr:efflux transporter outer membrane subunit [Pseudomonadales bacterium]